jgi:alanine racemase
MTTASWRPTRAVIDLEAVAHNVATLAELVAPADLWVVVKADGYGHGAVSVARTAMDAGARALAVAVVEEGLELRRAGIEAPVLVLADAPAAALGPAVADRLDLTVSGEASIDAAAAAAGAAGRTARVHLKLDTGMHRMGAPPADGPTLAARVDATEALELASVWTHLAVADEPGRTETADQLARLDAALAQIEAHDIEVPMVHAANSAGAIAHPAARRDVVRVGIATYGLAPSPELEDRVELRPAMSVRSAVSAVRRIEAGEGVSYGHHFVATIPTTIATVPIGYADGVPRGYGLRGGEVLIGGRRRPVVGAVTMDQLMFDCGDDPVAVGDEVVLLGRQGTERIGAWEWARLGDTIAYEVVCGIGPRVPRVTPPGGPGSAG